MRIDDYFIIPNPYQDEPEPDDEEIDMTTQLPTTTTEADNIAKAAAEDGGMAKMLKFKKGKYFLGGEEEVPLGRQYLAHCIGWTKAWIRFQDGEPKPLEPGGPCKMYYSVAKGERPPERDELGEMEVSEWPPGISGPHSDPWVQQYMLPMTDMETDEQVVFVTGSWGGRRAVGELCNVYANKKRRDPKLGQPVVRLDTVDMPTKHFGEVPRPHFHVVNFDGGDTEPVRDVPRGSGGDALAELLDDDMNDSIPY
jgi:hypothetical protein